jgi:Tol biopolymer transport system component
MGYPRTRRKGVKGRNYAEVAQDSVKLTNNNTNDAAPSYSPNGKRIAYVRPDRAGDYEIYTVGVGGNDKRKVTHNTSADENPSWGSR